MLTKYLAAGLLGSALLIAPVLADDPAATNAAKEKIGASTTADAYHGDWRASKVVGLNVYNNNNDNIGSINDLLMDKNGAIKAAVIGVGGFLGRSEERRVGKECRCRWGGYGEEKKEQSMRER